MPLLELLTLQPGQTKPPDWFDSRNRDGCRQGARATGLGRRDQRKDPSLDSPGRRLLWNHRGRDKLPPQDIEAEFLATRCTKHGSLACLFVSSYLSFGEPSELLTFFWLACSPFSDGLSWNHAPKLLLTLPEIGQ